MITVTCLHAEVKIAGRTYPLLTSFLTAEELLRVAEVPNFSPAKKHSEIANSLRKKPLDEWQRPPDDNRIKQIAAVFSDSGDPSLMANPVLLGNSTSSGGKWTLEPLMVGSGAKTTVPDVFQLSLQEVDPKALWILDGQHRILGMGASAQKSQKIPVVILLHEQVYPSHFLAKMFTQVTTEAKPMEPLHGEWMSYAFNMGDYRHSTWRRAMKTVIELVSLTDVDEKQNELLNHIRFNPYPEAGDTHFRTLRWNARQWTEAISKHYFGLAGTSDHLQPLEMAENTIRFLRAVVELDAYRDNGSRLSDAQGNPHPQLLDALLRAFFEYCASTGANQTQDDWNAFLRNDGRNFERCDWRLPWITASGSTSGAAHKPSQKALRLGMHWLFNDPTKLGDFPLAETLKGPGEILMEAFARNARGNKQTKKNTITHAVSTGSPKFNLSQDGTPRRDVRFTNKPDSLASVVSVEWRGQQPPLRWSKNDYIDLSALPSSGSTINLQVETYCYSSDSRQEISVTLLWS